MHAPCYDSALLIDRLKAPYSLLFELLKDLGLGEVRTRRLVAISQTFVEEPPDKMRPRLSRGTTTVIRRDCARGYIAVHTVKYPPTPVSHIPGCGPYALDSYRIFCVEGDEWKRVRPQDKELIKYLVSGTTILQRYELQLP